MLPQSSEYDVWTLIFDQTPVVLRIVLGVLTLGFFSLAGMLWRWNRKDLQRVEEQMHGRMDKMEARIDSRFDQLTHRLDNWQSSK